MAIINFNVEDFKHAESESEKKAMVEAWQEYTYDAPVILNEKSTGYSHYKNMIAESVLDSLTFAKHDLERIYGHADLDDEDDYRMAVKRMVNNLRDRAS